MKYFVLVSCCILLLSNCIDPASKQSGAQKDQGNNYLEQGQKIAAATFGTLSSNLQKAMEEGGVPNAVTYCNLTASPLVDSLENEFQVQIKRTALNVRNPNNQPTDREKQQLDKYHSQFDAGKEVKPVIHSIGNKTTFHAPIFIMPLCQKCHGEIGAQLKEEDYAVIQNLYPSDQAINYKSGDLRGMWSITFFEPGTTK